MSESLIVAPSILSANFASMGEDTKTLESSGADWIHIDIMDGSFVPPITFGAQMVQALRSYSSLPFDVHLMVEHPETQVENFVQAGADFITFHLEATIHAHRLLQHIKNLGKKAGIAIVPSTPVSALNELLCEVDIILVMSVNPGYGGQTMIDQTLKKIALLDTIRRENNFHYQISIDGGVNLNTIQATRQSGVDIIVVGSAFFAQSDIVSRKKFVENLGQM